MAIVGAGPAGSALARALTPTCRVLLVERQTQPSPRQAIGESLPGAALPLLAKLGLDAEFLREGHAERGATLSIWDRVEPEWRDSIRDPAGPGWHLDRRRFDALLQSGAKAGGAILVHGVAHIEAQRAQGQWRIGLRTPTARRELSVRVLVDASGRSSRLARSIGATRRVADKLLCLHAFLPPRDTDVDQRTSVVAAPYGWWYSVRLPQGGRVLALHLDADDPTWRRFQYRKTFLEAARQLKALADLIDPSASPSLHVRAAGSSALCPVAGEDWLAVGDAAVAFDPIASQGLFHALASAHKAAQVVREYLSGRGAAAKDYAEETAAVWQRYTLHTALTYAGPTRYAHHPFWARRRTRNMAAATATPTAR